MHSIRSKLTAITIAAILTSILSVVAAGYLTVNTENERNTKEIMNLISKNTSQTLEAYFSSIEQSVKMTANIAMETLDSVTLVEGGVAGTYAAAQERTPEQVERIDAYLTEHCEKVEEAFTSVSSRTLGVITYYYCINPEVSENVRGFFFSKVGKTGFDRQPPLDARQLDPNDTAHTAWYFTPVKRGRPSWIGPYKAIVLDELNIMSYLVPIYKSGTLIGVLGMDIPYKTLEDHIKPIHIYREGFAGLLDENNNVIYHPYVEAGKNIFEAGLDAPPDVFEKDTNGSELIEYQIDHEVREMAFSELSNGMKLFVTAPKREINASWTRLTRIILLITGVIIAIFFILSTLTIRFITDPLVHLTSASEKLSAGNYDVELNYEGKDEVGKLTSAFLRMRDHLQNYISDLNRRIHTDDLTGLPNIFYFQKLAEKERKRLKEAGKEPVFLHFNLIGMKYYNRQFGYSEGDHLIIEAGKIIADQFGETCCARFGLDQYVAICEENGLNERLNTIFEQFRNANDGRSLPVRVGIYPDRMDEVDVKNACDRAKYANDKRRGSYESCYTYFDQNMLEQSENYRYIINNLDRALKEHWIKVYYQPIVRAVNGRVCDEEALSRWIDPEKGFLSPGEFIPILEGAKLIYKLDLYVLDQVLEKMKTMKQSGLEAVPQSVNLSRVDFDTCDIVEEICRRVDEAGIGRDMLTIEVTESIIGEDFDFMKQQIERFQSLGFKVWMDDFGSGYSSLDVLQSIHFDLLKFDMRFMQRFEEGNESKIILTELIKMAINLGIDTLTEGVETEEQAEFLTEAGCAKLQGYYFGKPIPLEEIVERNRLGIQIRFENGEESEYFSKLGKVNLYDLSITGENEERVFQHLFDSMPIALMEIKDDRLKFVRCNRAYREYMRMFYHLKIDSERMHQFITQVPKNTSFEAALKECVDTEDFVYFDDRFEDGTIAHVVLRLVAKNPVSSAAAFSVAVITITPAS